MQRPLSRAWETLTRYPALALVPLVWNLIAYGLFRLMVAAPAAREGHNVTVKFLLPTGLPDGSKLLGDTLTVGTTGLTMPAVVPGVIGILTALAGAFVTAGYIHLLRLGLEGEAPTMEHFWEGFSRFGGRLLAFNLLLVAAFLIGLLVAVPLGVFGAILLLVAVLFSVVFILVEYLIVLEDLPVGEALSQAPGRLSEQLGSLFTVALVSLGLSALSSLVLSALGLKTVLLAIPLWAWIGTWLGLAVVAILLPPAPSAPE